MFLNATSHREKLNHRLVIQERKKKKSRQNERGVSPHQHHGPPYQHYFGLPIVYSVGLLGHAYTQKEREKERRERKEREGERFVGNN